MQISDLKIRTQIMILFAIIIIIVFASILTTQIVLLNIMKSNFDERSTNILIGDIERQLTNQMLLYDERLKTILNQIFQKQQIFLNVYLFVDTYQDQLKIQDPTFCPSNITIQDSLSMFCLMAYQYDESNYTELSKSIQQQFKLVSLFHETIFMFDPSQFMASGIAYTTTDSIPILGTWPALNSTTTYNAHKRKWYLSHMASMSNGFQHEYSDLFTTIIGSYTIAISQNITNKLNEFAGIVFNLLDFQAFKSNFNANYILVNSQGQIIIGQFKYPQNTTHAAFFYNESITGFTEDDWGSVLSVLQNNKSTSDLSNCERDFSTFLCRYNHYFEQEILIIPKKLEHPPYPPHIVIIFMNITVIQNQIDQLHKNIYSLFMEQAIFYLILLVSGIIATFILFFVVLNQITKPLNSLIQYTLLQRNTLKYVSKQHQQDNKILELLNLQKERQNDTYPDFSDNALSQLTFSYFQLLQSLNQQGEKSEQCRLIEERNYPKKNKSRFPRLINYHFKDYKEELGKNRITQYLYKLLEFRYK